MFCEELQEVSAGHFRFFQAKKEAESLIGVNDVMNCVGDQDPVSRGP